MHRKVAAALVAALALAVASCGGSEETLTRAQLVRRIETACRDGQLEGARQARGAQAQGQTGFIAAMLAGQRKQVDELDGVEASGATKADYEAYKAGIQARIDALERVAQADRAEFQRALRAATPAAEAAARRIEAAVRSLGLDGCG